MQGCLNIIGTNGTDFHLVEAGNGRGKSVEEIKTALNQFVVNSHEYKNIFEHTSITEGVRIARQEAANKGQLLIICRTFFIMSEARQALGIEEIRDDFDMNERIKQQSVSLN